MYVFIGGLMGEKERITILFRWEQKNIELDLDIPTDITAHSFVLALNEALDLDINTDDLSNCYLKTEEPIALLKGNHILKDFGLHDGTIVNFTI